MIERVSHCVRNSLCPLLEFLIAAARSCDVLLRHTVASHGSPLVVVASEPDLCQVLELMVACNHFRDKVAVIVDDRHLLRTLVIKFAGEIIREHEIVVNERLALDQTFKF